MVTFMARPAALAGVLAAGVVCQALICEPARADYYAFGNTLTAGYAVLDLDVNGTWEALTTLGVQGWISTGQYGTGGGFGTNTSYTVGFYNGDYFNNYFGFNFAGPACEVASPLICSPLPANAKITAANLVVYSGNISNNLTYTLYGATSLLSQMEMGSPNPTLYEQMMAGVSYGTFKLPENSTGLVKQLIFAFNDQGISDVQKAANQKATFAVAGYVDPPVPEPSTWIMMLAGFAGLGVIARRRAAKRRAATTVG
jgi:PEP-CTERM motif